VCDPSPSTIAVGAQAPVKARSSLGTARSPQAFWLEGEGGRRTNFPCSVRESAQAVAGGALEFGILGPLEVRRGGEPVELGAAKQRAVLARLLLQPGEPVSIDRLIEDLWGDEAPRTAAHTIQVYVSALRKALGGEAIRRVAGGYLLDVAEDGLDAARFTALAARARGEQPARAAASLKEALALWRGPALADFRYESFAQVGIAQLEEERLVALEERFGPNWRPTRGRSSCRSSKRSLPSIRSGNGYVRI